MCSSWHRLPGSLSDRTAKYLLDCRMTFGEFCGRPLRSAVSRSCRSRYGPSSWPALTSVSTALSLRAGSSVRRSQFAKMGDALNSWSGWLLVALPSRLLSPVVQRRTDWFALGLLATALAFLAFAGSTEVSVSRYYLPTLALVALAIVRATPVIRRRLQWLIAVGLVTIGVVQVPLAREMADDWVSREQQQESIVREVLAARPQGAASWRPAQMSNWSMRIRSCCRSPERRRVTVAAETSSSWFSRATIRTTRIRTIRWSFRAERVPPWSCGTPGVACCAVLVDRPRNSLGHLPRTRDETGSRREVGVEPRVRFARCTRR